MQTVPHSRYVRANTPKRVQWTKQPGVFGAALQFSQGRCAVRRENWLSAREHRPGYDAKLQVDYLSANFTRRKTQNQKQTLAPWFWSGGFVFEQVLGLEPHGGEPAGLGFRYGWRVGFDDKIGASGAENLGNGNPYKNQKTGFLPASQLAEYRFSFSFQTPAFAPGNGKRKMDLPRLTSASGRSPRSKFPQIPATGCSQPRRSG